MTIHTTHDVDNYLFNEPKPPIDDTMSEEYEQYSEELIKWIDSNTMNSQEIDEMMEVLNERDKTNRS